LTVPTTGRFAAQHGAKLLHDVNAQIARSTESQGVDEVHDLRVAIRRFHRVLDVLRPCFPRTEAKQIERALKKIISHAGDVRDIDIAIKLVGKVEPASENPSILAGKLQKDRAKAAATLHRILRNEGQQKSPKTPVPSTAFGMIPMDRLARRILPAMAAEHLRCVHKAARTNPSDKKIHQVRIEARNLRYTLECFAPIYGDELTIILEQLEDVQDRLGALHDCAIVREIVESRKSPMKKQTLEALKKRQEKKEQKFRKLYASAATETARLRQWKEILLRVRPPARKPRKHAAA
jgi:CHAD domain-containing protein